MFNEMINQFKFAANFLEQNSLLKPKRWEYNLQLISLFGFLFCAILTAIYSLNELTTTTNIWLSLAYKSRILWGITMFFGSLFYCYRSFKSIVPATILLFKGLKKQQAPTSFFVYSTLAALWKYKAPIASACAICIGGGIAANSFYYETFGVSPSREIALAYSKRQTWDQAWNHVLNAQDYSNSDHLPYIQDMEKNMQNLEVQLENQKNVIKELQKKLDDIDKK